MHFTLFFNAHIYFSFYFTNYTDVKDSEHQSQFEDQFQIINLSSFWFQKVFIKVDFFHEYLFPKVGSLTNLWSSDKVALALQNVLKNCHAYHLFLLGLFPSHTGPLVTGVCNFFASYILTVVMNDIVNIKKKKKTNLTSYHCFGC